MSLFELLRSLKKQERPQVKVATPATGAIVNRRRKIRINARPGTLVLIIDDSPTVVAALTKTLRSQKYTVVSAGDAESGLEIVRLQSPGLIFLDIVLPGMNGFAALRKIRRDPQSMYIPVIMISGNEQATEQFYANRIGADDFMKKPFARHEVFAKIEQLLDHDRIPRRLQFLAEAAVAATASPVSPPDSAA